MAGDTLLISTRALGRRQPLLGNWRIDFPPDLPGDDDGPNGMTLRDLITLVVTEQVRQFREQQQENQFLRVLTQRQMEQQAAAGRVFSGGSEIIQKVDEDQAVATALVGFIDGLYLVIVDEMEQHDLESQVFLQPDSRVVFLRLVMLAGG